MLPLQKENRNFIKKTKIGNSLNFITDHLDKR